MTIKKPSHEKHHATKPTVVHKPVGQTAPLPPEESIPTIDPRQQMVVELKAREKKWIAECSGKPNFNPYIEARKLIHSAIHKIEDEVTPLHEAKHIFDKVPVECPCIDPNYVEPKPEGAPKLEITPEKFGEKNIK